MPARPPSSLPPTPFLSHHPLHPYSSLFITGSWVVEEGPLYIVLAFPGSNPLHKVDGREPRKPAGTFGLWRELFRSWMGSGHREALADVVAWNTTSQGSLTPKPRQVVLFEGWSSHYGFSHALHISFCVCVCIWVYVCFCVAGSVGWGAHIELAHLAPLDRHAY